MSIGLFLFLSIVVVLLWGGVVFNEEFQVKRCISETEQYVQYIKPHLKTSVKTGVDEKHFMKQELVECLTLHHILYKELYRIQHEYGVSIKPVGTMDSGFLIEWVNPN
jgi:hypothetical protein